MRERKDAGEEQTLQDVTDKTRFSLTELIHRSLFETGRRSSLGTELVFFSWSKGVPCTLCSVKMSVRIAVLFCLSLFALV